MEMKIEMTLKHDHLYVRVLGDFDPSRAEVLFAEAVEKARSHSLSLILGDLTGMTAFESGNQVVGRFQTASSVAQLLPSDMKVAFWESQDQYMPDHFGENVAVNRGANTKVTTKLDEALEWLGVDTANKPNAGGD